MIGDLNSLYIFFSYYFHYKNSTKELKKYDDKQETLRVKKENAKRKALEKERLAKEKAAAKLESKLSKMTPEQLQRREEKLALKQKHFEERWAKEEARGEAYYQKIQEELGAINNETH